MNEIEELKERVKRLEFLLSLITLESNFPMTSAFTSTKMNEENFHQVNDVLEKYDDLISKNQNPHIESFYTDMLSVDNIEDNSDVMMIISGFYQARRWQRVGAWFIKTTGLDKNYAPSKR